MYDDGNEAMNAAGGVSNQDEAFQYRLRLQEEIEKKDQLIYNLQLELANVQVDLTTPPPIASYLIPVVTTTTSNQLTSNDENGPHQASFYHLDKLSPVDSSCHQPSPSDDDSTTSRDPTLADIASLIIDMQRNLDAQGKSLDEANEALEKSRIL